MDWTSLHHGAGEADIISAFVIFAQKLGRAFGQWLTGILMGLVGFMPRRPFDRRLWALF